MSFSGLFRFGTNRPWYVGTAVDKLFVAAVPAAYAVVTIPLLIWAFITFIVSELVTITANMYNWGVVTFLMFTLFTIFVLYEPIFSLVLQIFVPFIQILIFFAIILLNVLLIVLRVLIDVWNAFIPILLVVVVFLVDIIVTFLTLLADLINEVDLTGFFYDIMEVLWVFVDISFDVWNLIFSLAPTVLVFLSQIVGVVLLIIFESIFFLVPYLTWLLETLPPAMIPILDAVVKLVEFFSSYQGSLRLRSLRSFDANGNTQDERDAPGSSRFDDGIVTYFSTLHSSLRGKPVDKWQIQTKDLADAARHRLNIIVRPSKHITNPHTAHRRSSGGDDGESAENGDDEADADGDNYYRHTENDVDYSVDTLFRRRSLASRFRREGSPFHHPQVHTISATQDLMITDPMTGRRRLNMRATIIGAAMDHVTMLAPAHESRKRGTSNSADMFVYQMHKRARRGAALATAASEAAHRTLDKMPFIEDHAFAVQSSFTGLAKKYGFDGPTHALKHYRTRYETSWHFLLENTPDFTQVPLMGMLIEHEHNQTAPSLRRRWWHEWRRSDNPVRGFRDDRALNAALEKSRRETRAGAGQQPGLTPAEGSGGLQAQAELYPDAGSIDPAILPITSVADCYTTDPRNILCLPQIPYSWKIPLFELEFPAELNRDCPGFIDPPNLLIDGSAEVFHWFNPWVIFYNTFNWIRTLLSWFAGVVFLFDAVAVRFAPLRFLTVFLISADPRDAGLDVTKFICLIIFIWYPLAFIYIWYTIGILWPPVSRFFLKSYTTLSATFRAWNRSTGRYQEWLNEPDPLAFPTRFYPRRQVAHKYFLHSSPYEAHTRSVRPYPVYNQVIKRGVLEDGTQWDMHSASAGIDGASSSTTKQITSKDDLSSLQAAVADQHHMEALSKLTSIDIATLIEARVAPIKTNTSLVALNSFRHDVARKLERTKKRHQRVCTQLGELVDRIHATGLIDGSINSEAEENMHRVPLFANRQYIHGHCMTPTWIMHLAESIGYEAGHTDCLERYVAL